MGAQQIRCPVCGEWNPADAPRCLHCGAPLRPEGDADASPWPEDASPSTDWEPVEDEEGSETDWLRQILGTELLDEDRSDDSASWLDFSLDMPLDDHAGAEQAESAPPPQSERSAPSEEMPAETATASPSEAVEGLSFPETGIPDEAALGPWFADAVAASAEEATEHASPVDEGELPAWMADLARPEGAEAPEAEVSAPEAEGGGWPWAEAEAAPAGEAEPGAEAVDEGELPAWMADLARPEGAEAPEAEVSAPEAEGGGWPWAEAEAAPAGEAEPGAEAAVDEGELPAWMADLARPEGAEAPEAEVSAPEAEGGGWPWAEAEAAPAGEAEPGAEAVDEGELPAWMADLARPEGAETPEAPSPPVEPEPAPAELEAGDLGDLSWAEEPVAPPDEGLLPEEVPDWFRDFGEPEEDETVAEPEPAAPTADRPQASVPRAPEAEAERPAWVDALKPEGADEPPVAPPESGGLVFDPDALFAEAPEEDEEGEPPLAVEGLPEESVQQAAPAQSEMPAWVSELAPETSEAAEGTAAVIDALAGLPDLLPPDPSLAPKRVRLRPPFKLRLNRQQTERAQWLRALLEDEARPRQIDLPWEGLDLPRGVWRALTFVVLVAFAWFAAWLPAAPPQASADTAQAWATVEALPPHAPVLVSVDVSWLNAAEMEAIARPLLQHLAARESQVVMVSTVPWGVHLGPSWAPPSLTLWEAGFIPGGPVALAQFGQTLPFALHLSGATLDVERVPSWRTVQDWSDVPLVVVLVDNSELLRLWFEQVTPRLPTSTRVILGVSEQAAPVVEAYRPAVPAWGGAVVGFEGGLAYQQRLQMPTEASAWPIYRALLVGGAGWMLVSALAYGVVRVVRARRRAKAAA